MFYNMWVGSVDVSYDVKQWGPGSWSARTDDNCCTVRYKVGQNTAVS